MIETRIKNQTLLNLDLPNCSFIHVNTTTNAGGVAMYIYDNLKYKVCENQYRLCNTKPCELILSIKLIHLMLSK